MNKTIHRNCACIQTAFLLYGTELTGKPSAPFESAENSGLEKRLSDFTLPVYMISAFEGRGNGNTYEGNQYAYIYAWCTCGTNTP